MSGADRQQRHYENRIAQGFTRQCFWLSETARSALAELHRASGQTRDEIVSRALIAALESNTRPLESDAGKRPKSAQPQLLIADPDPGPTPSDSDENPSFESNVQASESHSTTSDSDTRSTSDSNGQSSDSDTPPDRRALAVIGHKLRKEGRNNLEIAEDFNRRNWTPDRIKQTGGAAPRRNSPGAWTANLISQLIQRDHRL